MKVMMGWCEIRSTEMPFDRVNEDNQFVHATGYARWGFDEFGRLVVDPTYEDEAEAYPRDTEEVSWIGEIEHQLGLDQDDEYV